MYKIIDGSVTSPKGFKASGVHAGIKKAKKDMALLVSDVPAVCAGVFTTNKAKAAPVIWDELQIKNSHARAVISNSGNANACTGNEGYDNVIQMASESAAHLDCNKEEVLVFSTGVIGVQLPMDKVNTGIKMLVPELSYDGGKIFAESILTTDTFQKECSVEIEIDGKKVIIAGAAKGSGMIHPNMATMFSMITTDMAIEKSLLQEMVSKIANNTFNMITVDGDTSTNDTFLVMANGMSGVKELKKAGSKAYDEFYNALHYVSEELAKLIVRDGEGASKFICVDVSGLKTDEDARVVAKSVCTSNLVKTAFFGEDANWGRILCACGYSGVDFDPYKVDIVLSSKAGSVEVAKAGKGLVFDEEIALAILKEKDIDVIIKFGEGDFGAKAWTCDFSFDYVKINASYRS